MDLNCRCHSVSLLFFVVFLVSSLQGFSAVLRDVFHSSSGLDQDAQALVEIRSMLRLNSLVFDE